MSGLTIDCNRHGEQALISLTDGQWTCELCANELREARKCACGCGASLLGRSARTIWHDDRCKQRGYRRRVVARAEAVGLPSSLSLRALDAGSTTHNRNGDAQTRGAKPRAVSKKPRKPSLRISYRKAVKAVSVALVKGELQIDAHKVPREQAEAALLPLLTPKQKEAL